MSASTAGASGDERAAKRQRILDAAEALLREGGADALSMRTLAQRAGVGHVTPYHLFDSKHGVLLAVLRRATEQLSRPVTAVAADADPLEDLLDRQTRLVDALALDEPFARALLLALDESAPQVERGLWLELVAARTAEDLNRLSEAGLVLPDAPLDLTRQALLVGRDGAVRRWFRGVSSLGQFRREDRAVVLHALLAVATTGGRARLWAELEELGSDS